MPGGEALGMPDPGVGHVDQEPVQDGGHRNQFGGQCVCLPAATDGTAATADYS